MKLSIITINFKKPLLTIACVNSLYSAYKEQFEKDQYELCIIDNFSEDDSVHILEKEVKSKKYKNIRVLAHKENNGFGGGNNYGAEHATGEYLLFLNNDTVVGKGLSGMMAFLENHAEIGIVGGPLKNTNGSQQSSSGKFYSLPRVFLLLLGLQRFNMFDTNPSTITKVDWVKGALLLIKKDFFEKLKGFDENIFMYTEDMELCFRARLLGKSTYFYPTVEIQHADQGSSSRSFAIVHIYSGILYFYKKHRSALEFILVKLLLQSKALFLVLYGKLTKNGYFIATYEKALNICR